MKICVIAPVVIPILGVNQKYGGIESVIFNVVEELSKRGHEIYVFASGDSKLSAKVLPTVVRALGQNASLSRQKTANLKAYKQALELKPDVIWDNTYALHAHKKRPRFPYKYLTRTNAVLNRRDLISTGNIPVVQTIHSAAKDYFIQFVSALSKSGQYMITISKDQAKRYREYIEDGQHLGTIYNPVDIDFYSPGPRKKGKYLLWVGRFSMEKGAHIAVAAANFLGLPILLVGKKTEKHEKDYFNKFVKPLLGQNAKYIGMAAARKKLQLLRNAKAVLMTNIWAEPFGLVAAEAMATGTPVVYPAVGSLTEMINGTGIPIQINDLNMSEFDEEITVSQLRYIERIDRSVQKLDSNMSGETRKRAVELFSVKNIADGYESAFKKAIRLKKIRDKQIARSKK
jgi:glycosyltransferase involved in cell wall biosynthesis